MSDLISRQAAIDVLHGYFDGMLETGTWSPCDVYGLIEILPSAQPEVLAHGEGVLNTQHDNDRIWEALSKVYNMDGVPDEAKAIIGDVMLGLDEQSAQPEQRWIPVTERLPEANGRYLVTRGLNACGAVWNRVYIINYSDLMGLKTERIWWDGNVGKSDFVHLDDVIAWMPLPEPYREDGEE